MPCSTRLQLSQAPAVSQIVRPHVFAGRHPIAQHHRASTKRCQRLQQRLTKAAASDSVKPNSSSNNSSSSSSSSREGTEPKPKAEERKQPNVLHFADPAGAPGILLQQRNISDGPVRWTTQEFWCCSIVAVCVAKHRALETRKASSARH